MKSYKPLFHILLITFSSITRQSKRFATIFLLAVLILFTFSGFYIVPHEIVSNASSPITGVGTWKEQTDYGASTGTTGTGGIAILGQSCVTYSGYVYCVGGQNSKTGNDTSDVFSTPISTGGTIGAWTETTDYGATSGTSGSGGVNDEFLSCVQYNGYIYCMGGASIPGPGIISDVFYAKLSSGSVGPWTETTDFGAASGSSGTGGVKTFELSCVVDSDYVYCLGGSGGSSKVFYAQLSTSGVGAWTETTDYGASSGSSGSGGTPVGETSCVDNTGYIYCVGGLGASFSVSSEVFFAPLSSNGVGAWTETTDYGSTSGNTGSGGVPIHATGCSAYNSTIFCVGGATTGNNLTADVFYAPLTGSGVGAWSRTTSYGDPLDIYHVACESGLPIAIVTFAAMLCSGGSTSSTYSAPILNGSGGGGSSSSSSSSTSTSSSSSSKSSTSSSSSSSSSSSASAVSSSSGFLIIPLVAIIVAIILGTTGFLFYRRKGGGSTQTEGNEPPPPPPPPQTPPEEKSQQQSTTPQQPVPCCGPDVTDNVLGAMIELLNDYQNVWNRTTKDEKFNYLTQVIGIKKGTWTQIDWGPFSHAWDIWELTTAEGGLGGQMESILRQFEETCMKPKDPCYPSVMFLENCHHPQVVNYVMWGVLSRLYDDWEIIYKLASMPPGNEYSDSTLSNLHYARSGTGLPKLTDPSYQDQVAMASVGWQLAQFYFQAVKKGNTPFDLKGWQRRVLQGILEDKENKSRKTVICQKGCGKFPSNRPFGWHFGPD